MKKTLALFAVSALLAGCSNPADDVPAAEVRPASDPKPEAVSTAPAKTGMLYLFSPESTIGFTGSKVTGSHDGGFRKFSGQFAVTDGKLTPRQVIKIDMTSLWADNEKLAGHLKNEDFFHVEKFPFSTFSSTAITESGSAHTVTGNLTLHGVTREISFPATIEVTKEQVRVQAEFSINRFDFDVKYSGRADDLIRNEVVIRLDITAKPAGNA